MAAILKETNRQTSARAAGRSEGDERHRALRHFLLLRRSQVQRALDARVAGLRDERASIVANGVLDFIETSEVNGQEALDCALAELETEMLGKFDEALRRLETGAYGMCIECGEPIAAARLRALPFAVRCRACEDTREADRERVRAHTHSRVPAALIDIIRGGS